MTIDLSTLAQTNADSDSELDDPQQWRSETAANVDQYNALWAALGIVAQLEIGLGLENDGGSPEKLRVQLAANSGLMRTAGLKLKIDTLVATAPAPGDLVALWDSSEGVSGRSLVSDILALAGLPPGHLHGMELSNGVDAAHDIGITVGSRRSEPDTGDMRLGSAFVKQLDATWAPGSAAGGRASSVSLTVDTWYHVHAIEVSGAVDVGFDTDVAAANLIADHTATEYRRLGSIWYQPSAVIRPFVMDGDLVQWKSPIQDATVVNMTADTAVLAALSVPPDVKVDALLNAMIHSTGNSKGIYFSDPAVDDEAPDNNSAPGLTMGGAINAGSQVDLMFAAEVRTNTAQQIRYRNNDSANDMDMEIATRGYRDQRGRLS